MISRKTEAIAVVIKPGNLSIYPRTFECPKCSSEFRVPHSEIKKREYTQVYRYDLPTGWKCLLLCCINRTERVVKEEEYVVCPTPECNSTVALTSNSKHDKTLKVEHEDNCCC